MQHQHPKWKPDEKPLSIRLRDTWNRVKEGDITAGEYAELERHELEKYTTLWERALLLPGESDLVRSILLEIGKWRGINDLALVRRRCETALERLKLHWQKTVEEVEATRVTEYYDTADDCIEELMWWHTLLEDKSPLAYACALDFALNANCTSYLDFGSGVGSGALLFANNGFTVTLADISSVTLSFCRFRFAERAERAYFVNLTQSSLPARSFDFITAMDVFEHLVDPVPTVDLLHHCLKPGGYIYGRFAAEDDPNRPQHIVRDFQPVFDRFSKLGFEQAFQDEWLWGHQVFRKTG